MAIDKHEPKAPGIEAMSKQGIAREYARQFHDLLENMRIPEGSAFRQEVENLRAHMKTKYKKSELLTEMDSGDAQDQIRTLWEEMSAIHNRLMEIRAQVIQETQTQALGIADVEAIQETLESRIAAAYGTSGKDTSVATKLYIIAEGLTDNPSDAASKRYFNEKGEPKLKAVLADKAAIKNILNNPTTPEQEKVLWTMVAMLDNIGATREINYKIKEFYAKEKERNDDRNYPKKLGRLILVAGGTLMATWSLAAKNKKLAAFWGGVAFLSLNPNILKGEDYFVVQQLAHLKSQEKHLTSAGSEEALADLFALHNSGDGKTKALLSAIRKTGELSKLQVQELAGTGTPLSALLMKIPSDKERAQFVIRLGKITKKESQELAKHYIQNRGGTII